MSITPPTVAAEFEARFQQPPVASPHDQEMARWQQMCKELIEERERLRAELAQTKSERDEFRRALIAPFAAKEVPFAKEEALASLDERPTLHELIEELDRAEP